MLINEQSSQPISHKVGGKRYQKQENINSAKFPEIGYFEILSAANIASLFEKDSTKPRIKVYGKQSTIETIWLVAFITSFL